MVCQVSHLRAWMDHKLGSYRNRSFLFGQTLYFVPAKYSLASDHGEQYYFNACS